MSGPTELEARTFITEHLGRDVGPVEAVGEGAWSTCFGFTDGDRELVIRFGRHVDDFEKDRRASTFGSAKLPVPEVTETGEALGGYFAISTRAHGQPLESIAAWNPVLPSLFAALDAMRAVEVPGTGFGGWDGDGVARCATWRDFLLAVDVDTPERRTHGWRRKLVDSPVGDEPFRAGLGRLADLALTVERHIVHGDLINRNVLVHDARITAVFDWGCSFYGDLLYDIAWLEFWSPWHPALAAIDIRARALTHYASIGLDVTDFDERLRACLIHIGLDHQAYCAFTGDVGNLIRITEQTTSYLD